jgi:hypothetical protein
MIAIYHDDLARRSLCLHGECRQRLDLELRHRAFRQDKTARRAAGETGPGSKPLDMTIDRAGRDLFVLDQTNGRVDAFAIERDGELELVDGAATLPPFSTGLAGF